MIATLDLRPALTVQKRLSRTAFFTALQIYLEALVAIVLVTEQALEPPMLGPLALVLAAQAIAVRRPVSLLVHGRLFRACALFLLLGCVFVALVWLGAGDGEPRRVAVTMGVLVVAATAWPIVAAMRVSRSLQRQLRTITDARTVFRCLSFRIGESVATRLRSFGGDRKRWLAPFLAAALTLAASAAALALLVAALGFEVRGGAGIAQISSIVAGWVFYLTMRRVKPRAAELRKRDTRRPVLILRQFSDDTLKPGRFSVGTRFTFEHFLVNEFDRLGPTISIGRPGERLPPLGASRDYVEDAQWQSTVATMMHEAGVVVCILGRSEALLWEVRTTLAIHGTRDMLVIVPPLRDREELRRRWQEFVQATADVLGDVLPRELPNDPVRALFFAGDDVLMVVGEPREASRRLLVRTPRDYRFAVRLFGCIRDAGPVSADAVDGFLRAQLPFVRVSAPRDART